MTDLTDNNWQNLRREPALYDPALDPAFSLVKPETNTAPGVVLFNSPHSGRIYPARFMAMSRLNKIDIRRSEDAFIDQLLSGVTATGAQLLHAHFPRAFLDVNRAADELDPAMFDGVLPHANKNRSAHLAAGLGVIPRNVSEKHKIYQAPMPVAEALWRIETFYRSYHKVLAQTMDAIRTQRGAAALIDCHSMPDSSTKKPGQRGAAYDIILGNRFGASCAPALIDQVEAFFLNQGYKLIRNIPYAGGYITKHYGRPDHACHALQIEINRGLYINEKTFAKTAGFTRLQQDLTALAYCLAKNLTTDNLFPAQAAE